MSTFDTLLSEALRPKALADLNLPDRLILSFERMVEKGSILNLLFYGKPGIGKTSAARILVNELGADVYELNGSLSDGDKTTARGIETFASTLSLTDAPKICFIDEADYLTKEVQASLRGVIEKVHHNTRFTLKRYLLIFDRALKDGEQNTIKTISGALETTIDSSLQNEMPTLLKILEDTGHIINSQTSFLMLIAAEKAPIMAMLRGDMSLKLVLEASDDLKQTIRHVSNALNKYLDLITYLSGASELLQDYRFAYEEAFGEQAQLSEDKITAIDHEEWRILRERMRVCIEKHKITLPC